MLSSFMLSTTYIDLPINPSIDNKRIISCCTFSDRFICSPYYTLFLKHRKNTCSVTGRPVT